MKVNFMQENVILETYEGPYGLPPVYLKVPYYSSPISHRSEKTMLEAYKDQYKNKKIMKSTDENIILEVGDWFEYFYILGIAK